MSDKVEIDLEDLDDLKDLIGDERKKADFSFQKVFSLLVLNWQYFLTVWFGFQRAVCQPIREPMNGKNSQISLSLWRAT